jgi:26S proteasome regulatory subunit T4
MSNNNTVDPREAAIRKYRAKMIEHTTTEAQAKKGTFVFVKRVIRTLNFDLFLFAAREDRNALERKYDKSEDDLKAVQNVGQIIGEVLKKLDEERCAS